MRRDLPQLRALRVVLVFWLAGWFINAPGDPGFLLNFSDALDHPIHYDLFPVVLTDPRVAYATYLAPMVCVLGLFVSDPRALRASTFVMVGASLLACVHLETCNDATFVTSFWVALFACWLAHNAHRRGRRVLVIGRGLAHAIVGLVFLGALSVKLTPQFRSGEAFFGLYFLHGTGFPYDVLRKGRSAVEYRELATWFSRAAISAETVLVASPLLPTQFVLPFYALVMVGMMVARNYNLFSVLGAPLGLLIAAELMRRRSAP